MSASSFKFEAIFYLKKMTTIDSVGLSVGLATGIPKLIHYRVVLFHALDSGLSNP